jgi:hypothetical protein
MTVTRFVGAAGFCFRSGIGIPPQSIVRRTTGFDKEEKHRSPRGERCSHRTSFSEAFFKILQTKGGQASPSQPIAAEFLFQRQNSIEINLGSTNGHTLDIHLGAEQTTSLSVNRLQQEHPNG